MNDFFVKVKIQIVLSRGSIDYKQNLRIGSINSKVLIKASDGKFSRQRNTDIEDDCSYKGHAV